MEVDQQQQAIHTAGGVDALYAAWKEGSPQVQQVAGRVADVAGA